MSVIATRSYTTAELAQLVTLVTAPRLFPATQPNGSYEYALTHQLLDSEIAVIEGREATRVIGLRALWVCILQTYFKRPEFSINPEVFVGDSKLSSDFGVLKATGMGTLRTGAGRRTVLVVEVKPHIGWDESDVQWFWDNHKSQIQEYTASARTVHNGEPSVFSALAVGRKVKFQYYDKNRKESDVLTVQSGDGFILSKKSPDLNAWYDIRDDSQIIHHILLKIACQVYKLRMHD